MRSPGQARGAAMGNGQQDRTWLVAIAAALWGTDGLLRLPLAESLPSATVVFWEHLLVVIVLVPWIPTAARAMARCGRRERLAMVVVGGGSSALATALFTAAFSVGDPITPLVLQKLQPLFAMVAAFVVLGERMRASYALFALPALAGAWLLAFANPLDVQLTALRAALLAIGAAALWAAGTVLGRLVSTRMAASEVTVLRFFLGLPVAAVILLVRGDAIAVSWGNVLGLALLAFIPGLIALSLYYVGLRSTPAARATLAELAFPATAAVIGVSVLDADMSGTQWLGLAIVAIAVTALGWHEKVRRKPAVLEPAVTG